MRIAAIVFVAVMSCVWALPARADWDPQDPDPNTKWVQLPDPNGWDVNDVFPNVLASDFQCTDTGYITDVHLWGSWKGDDVGQLTRISLAIFADIPATRDCNYSRPGEMLWNTVVDTGQVGDAYKLCQVGTGDQGWYSPAWDSSDSSDHEGIWQVNLFLDQFLSKDELFHQEEGTVYWLGVTVATDWPDGSSPATDTVGTDSTTTSPKFGWKTSLDHWNDDAVWGYLFTREDGETEFRWNELTDPCTGDSLDLAFVLTGTSDGLGVPEPGMTAIAGFGLLTLLVRRRKK